MPFLPFRFDHLLNLVNGGPVRSGISQIYKRRPGPFDTFPAARFPQAVIVDASHRDQFVAIGGKVVREIANAEDSRSAPRISILRDGNKGVSEPL